MAKLRDLIIDLVQEGFQDFFQKLEQSFLLLSGRANANNLDSTIVNSVQVDKVQAGLTLVVAQLSVFIEQSAVPRIMEARNLYPHLHCQFLFCHHSKVSHILVLTALLLPIRKLLFLSLEVVFVAMRMGQHSCQERSVDYSVHLVKNFCIM